MKGLVFRGFLPIQRTELPASSPSRGARPVRFHRRGLSLSRSVIYETRGCSAARQNPRVNVSNRTDKRGTAMPRPRSVVPTMRLHKPSGRAVVYIQRRPVYLGRWGSSEANEAYGKLIAKLAQGQPLEAAKANEGPAAVKVSRLLLKYVTEKLPRYSRDEQHCQRGAIRVLRQLFGETPLLEFGPLKLRVVRDAMVAGDPEAVDANGKPDPRAPWSRGYVNRQIKRLRAIFKWGVSFELVPQTLADSLASVASLKPGETDAADYAQRESVPLEEINAVRARLKPRDQDILDLMLLTGARPGELVGLRVQDVDRSGDVWRAELTEHKTAHHGKKRVLFFNRAAQAILMRHIKADPDARFFITRRQNFSERVAEACEAVGLKWVPHQLRHTAATTLADEIGLEAAQHVLGHSNAAMTAHYSRAAERTAREAVKRLGGD